MVARFVRAKNDSILSERQRAARYRAAAASTKERKLQRQKGSCLPLLAAPLVASLMGTLKSFEEKKGKKYVPKRRKGMGMLQGVHTLAWVLCLASIYFLRFRKERLSLYYPISFLGLYL